VCHLVLVLCMGRSHKEEGIQCDLIVSLPASLPVRVPCNPLRNQPLRSPTPHLQQPITKTVFWRFAPIKAVLWTSGCGEMADSSCTCTPGYPGGMPRVHRPAGHMYLRVSRHSRTECAPRRVGTRSASRLVPGQRPDQSVPHGVQAQYSNRQYSTHLAWPAQQPRTPYRCVQCTAA
jgi:hypothetical protein